MNHMIKVISICSYNQESISQITKNNYEVQQAANVLNILQPSTNPIALQTNTKTPGTITTELLLTKRVLPFGDETLSLEDFNPNTYTKLNDDDES